MSEYAKRLFTLRSGGVHLLAAALLGCAAFASAQATKPAADAAPDVLVLNNGDAIHGKLVSEIAGKVTFHTDAFGDVVVTWDKIKELRASGRYAVLDKNVKMRGKKSAEGIPSGTVEVANEAVTVHPEGTAPAASIPVKDAQYIVDDAAFEKQINHEPSFFQGWNGAATAGATLVTATQNQYTFSGAIDVVRAVPTMSWLNPRNRTEADFSASYGKITQPGYFDAGVFIPATYTKSSIFHADAERDQYISPRFYALVQTAFDHNYAQDLQLQQIYGGGIGWTAIKAPKEELDLKGTIQYEKQQFISGASGTNQNLIGSTFAANYLLHLKLFTYTQGLSYIPAYNTPRAYSANETNTFAFPTYKNLAFSLGTIDTYLNDPPISLPPTKLNSFQFTMGLTYAIKSKY